MGGGGKRSAYLGKAAKFGRGKGKQAAGRNSAEQEDGDGGSPQRASGEASADEPEPQQPQQQQAAASSAVMGLNNLGNTCFFNSSLQLLLACAPLQQMLLQPDHQLTKGPLGYALQQAAKFMDGRASGAKVAAPTYNPQALLSAVCCHAPVFRGKQQHDSHELMRMLLDGLQTQEQRYQDLARRGGSSSSAAGQAKLAAVDRAANGIAGPDVSSSDSDDSSSSSSSSSQDDSEGGEGAANDSSSSSSAGDGGGSSGGSVAGSDADQASTSTGVRGNTSTRRAGGGDTAGAAVGNSFAALTDPEGSQASDTCAAGASGDTPQLDSGSTSSAESAAGSSPVSDQQAAPGDCQACGARQQPNGPLARRSLLPPEPPSSAGSTSVDELFGGVLVSTIVCTGCGHTSVSYEPFLDLSLPIPLPEAGGGGLARKGSLLSRLAGRSAGSKKKGGKAAAATAAADEQAADTEDQQQSGAAAASHSGAKMGHKERRRLQQEAQRAAREQKKLARMAAKKQQEQQEADEAPHAAARTALDAAAVAATLPGAAACSVPAPAQPGSSLHSSASGGGGEVGDEQQVQDASTPALPLAAQLPPPQQQQAQQQLLPNGTAAGAPSAARPAGALLGDSDGDSTASAWTDLGGMAPAAELSAYSASPPTHAVGCFGGGWDPLPQRPSASAALTALPPPTSSQPPSKPLHRRFSSLGSLSALTSTARGGLSSLFGGWQGGGRQGSRDCSGGASGLGSAGTAGGPADAASAVVRPPPRPASALGLYSVAPGSSPEPGAGLEPTRGTGGGASGLWSEEQGGAGSSAGGASGGGAQAALQVAAPLGNGDEGAPGAAAKSAVHQEQQEQQLSSPQAGAGGSSGGARHLGIPIPEDAPVTLTPSMARMDAQCRELHLRQLQQRQQLVAAAADGGGSGVASSQQQQQQQQQPASSSIKSPFAEQQAGFVPLANGSPGFAAPHVQQQPPAGCPGDAEHEQLQRSKLQRASSDDAVVRLGSQRRISSSTSSSSGGGGGGRGAPAAASGASAKPGACPAAAAPAGGAPPGGAGPFATAAAAAAAAAALGAPPPDPLAAAATAAAGQPLAVSHCLASFFLREEVAWECPKEKAQWKERRVSLCSGGLSGTDPHAQAAAAAPVAAAAGGEEGPIFKQVSFSDKHPEVILVPGSVEQRGTDLSAALAGAQPFVRALSWSGAALLLTAQLARQCAAAPEQRQQRQQHQQHQQEGGEPPEAAWQLRLGLRGAGEGTAAAAKLLPGGQPLQLGEVQLPDVQSLPPDAQAPLLQAWAQLVLNCMADLVTHEGGLDGLRAMLRGRVRLLRNSAAASAPLSGRYLAGATDSSAWRVVGRLPLGAAAPDGGSPAAEAHHAPPEGAAGWWEYPAGGDGGEAEEEPSALQQGGAVAAPSAPAADSGDGGDGAVAQRRATEDEPDGVFAMDQEEEEAASEQGEQGRGQWPVQCWEGDTAASAAAPSESSGAGSARGLALGSRDSDNSSRGSSVFRRLSAAPHDPTAAVAVAGQPAADGGDGTGGGGGSSQERQPPAAADAAAGGASASRPVDIRAPRASAAAALAMPAVGASPSSGTPRSSLRRRSATFSRPAHKAYRVHLAPPVLMLHLKRFQHDGKGRLTKLDTAVKFGFELDLSPFMAAAAPAAGAGGLQYDLVGVVVHMGTMRGGHYVAYVRRGPPAQPQQRQQPARAPAGGADAASDAASAGSRDGSGRGAAAGRAAAAAAATAASPGAGQHQWFYVSDTMVKAVSRSEVASAQAYLLMYVRRG